MIKMQLTTEQSRRIQQVRGICILAMMLSHCIPFMACEAMVAPFCHFCVGVFTFLSGLLTASKLESVGGFYKKRMLKVLLPYLIWSLVYTLLMGNWNSFVYNILTGQCCSVYYYIFVYLQLVLLTPLIAKLVDSKFFRLGYVITPAVLLLEYGLALKGAYPTFPFNCNNFAVWFGFYFFGMRCNRFRRGMAEQKAYGESRDADRAGSYVLAAAIAFGLLVALELKEAYTWMAYGNYGLSNTPTKVTSFAVGILLCNLAYLWIFSPKKELPPLEKGMAALLKLLGDASFGMYLCHQLVIFYLNQIPGWSEEGLMIRLTVVTLLSFLLTECLHVLLRRFGKYLGV